MGPPSQLGAIRPTFNELNAGQGYGWISKRLMSPQSQDTSHALLGSSHCMFGLCLGFSRRRPQGVSGEKTGETFLGLKQDLNVASMSTQMDTKMGSWCHAKGSTQTCETEIHQVGKLSYFTLRKKLTLRQIDHARPIRLPDLLSEIASVST